MSPRARAEASHREARISPVKQPRPGEAQRSVARPKAARGEPLAPAVRGAFEAGFGHGFGDVRIHRGAEAAALAGRHRASALAVGHDLYFAAGRYAPLHGRGQALLAHELAHVVQHDRAGTLLPGVGAPGSPHEAGADRAAAQLMQGRPAEVAPASQVPAVQCQPAGDEPAPSATQLQMSPWFLRSMGRLEIDDFPTGQSTLTGSQQDRIRGHAGMLRQLLGSAPGGRISVTGHGDAVGTDERNRELGQARAEAVRAVLVEAGLDAALIDADSAGESSPAVPAAGAEARNRRAVVGFTPPLRMPGLYQPPPLSLGGDLRLDPPGSGRVPPGGLTPAEPFVLPRRDPLMPQVLPTLPGPRRDADRPEWWRPIPPAPAPTPDGLRDFLRRDPLLNLLPDVVRDGLADRLADAPEDVIDEALSHLPATGEARDAASATLRALWRLMRGRRWEPPPQRDPRFDAPPMQPFPQSPGQMMLPLPAVPLGPDFLPQF